MEWKNYLRCIIKGVIVALIFTVLFSAILSLVMMYVDLSSTVLSVSHIVISCISLVTGCVLAAKAHSRKGWIVGLGVAIMFYIALLLTGVLFGAEEIFSIYVLIKFMLCALIGLLSGMLGINL